MKALILALMLIAAPASANAFCFSSFHQPKVEQQKIETVNGVPVAIKTVAPRKPDSFCQTVMRASAITLVVQGIVITAKVALAIGTGVIIF
jgi:cyclic lactone autoinducer peptide